MYLFAGFVSGSERQEISTEPSFINCNLRRLNSSDF